MRRDVIANRPTIWYYYCGPHQPGYILLSDGNLFSRGISEARLLQLFEYRKVSSPKARTNPFPALAGPFSFTNTIPLEQILITSADHASVRKYREYEKSQFGKSMRHYCDSFLIDNPHIRIHGWIS